MDTNTRDRQHTGRTTAELWGAAPLLWSCSGPLAHLPDSALLPAVLPGQAGSQQGEEGAGGRLYLDGGDEGSGEVGAKAGGQGQLADVLVLSQGAGNGLLAQQLQAGHPVLHTHHVQGRS